MAGVTLSNIRKVFPGHVVAVDGIDLAVNDGEFMVMVGPSGCGKSTTLRIIAGLESPTEGRVSIGERDVTDEHPKDRDIAMVFQNYALYPHMTAHKNLAFGLRMRKTPGAEIDRRIREAAHVLGIEDVLHRKPKALSGGQRQRVAVGRAIVRNPACFLFDEPLSNLDAKLRVQMRAELKALHLRLKTTTVYVTHDQEEAMTLGDRIAVMAGGIIQQLDTPLEVYRRPANRFVAGFMGMPPMNFIDGRIHREDGHLMFKSEPSLAIDIVPAFQECLDEYIGKDVTLGVRCEAFRIVDPSETWQESIEAGVLVTELLGDRQDVYAELGTGTRVIARVPADVVCHAGDTVRLQVSPAGMHFFEPGDFGRNISGGSAR